ncbi:Hypothetical predicted protein, partial [Paramuricea clavata]
MSISQEVPNDLVVDEVSYEVKNVCDLMNAVFFEAVVCEIRRLLKEKCPIIRVRGDTTVLCCQTRRDGYCMVWEQWSV